jgi:regulator of sigma E protease
MNVLFIILCAVIVIGFLVFIHEGGHYLSARAFGVRVSEFMLGLPGPSIGFTRGNTRFGLTCVPLGGYAKICGMDTSPVHDSTKRVIAYIYKHGSASAQDITNHLLVPTKDATEILEQLAEWGTVVEIDKRSSNPRYQTPAYMPSKKDPDIMPGGWQCREYAAGEPREITDMQAFYDFEYSQLYRSLPFWKRSIILLAGIFVNLLFAIIAFILVYSVIGIDITNTQTGEVTHFNATPLQSIQAGFIYIGMAANAIISLFNPQTAAETVSNSTSIVGIAVMSADYFAAGLANGLFFMAMISVSLGLMNLIPIPPLDGGRFLVEIIQKIIRRDVSPQVLGAISMAGMALFLGLFAIMLNQDIQRFIIGN